MRDLRGIIIMGFKKLRRVIRLSLALAKAEFKLRNENSYLGILWHLLNPILLFTLLMLVFADRLGREIPSYPAYLIIGIVMFNLFLRITSDATRIIYQHMFIIKSIRFPHESLAGSVILKALFSHVFEIMIVAVFIFISGSSMIGFVFYPILLFLFCIFTFGVSLALSSITIYFRDLENIWEFALRLLWFATPIFYDIGGQARLFKFSLINPMYYFITAAREIIISSKMPQPWIIFGIAGYSIISIAAGMIVFNALKRKIPEMV